MHIPAVHPDELTLAISEVLRGGRVGEAKLLVCAHKQPAQNRAMYHGKSACDLWVFCDRYGGRLLVDAGRLRVNAGRLLATLPKVSRVMDAVLVSGKGELMSSQ